MDAKDLRIQPVQSESTHSHDGNINYASSASSIHYDKNKSYHGIGSNSLSKVDVQTSRPCAVIGPDRIVPAPAAPDPSIKRAHVVPWSFTRPPDYPHNITDYQQQLTRNISPRQTYQENMPRHVLPPGYTTKMNEDMNAIEKNALASKTSKSNLPHEVKYSEVPYNVSSLSSDPKSSRSSELPVNNQNPSLMRTHTAWPQGNNVHLTRPYAAPELYQYPEYANCNAPRALPMRPHRPAAEEPLHMYPDPYHRGANIRYEPYPPTKDRYQQTRYDYIPSYSNPYAASHFMQKLPPNIPPHPYSGYPQTKYLDKVRDPHRDAYQRIPNPQGGYNVAYPNQGLHTNYGSIPGNCVQNKFYAYPSDANAHPAVPSKTPFIQNKSYAPHEYFYPSEAPRSHQMKPQMMMPGYLPIHMQPLPSYPYYRKDPSMLPVKNYDFSQIKNIDPYTNQMSRVAPQFSPSIISPVESTASSDVNHSIAISPEDCGYVSQSSTASARSSDSALNYYRALEHRYGHMQRPSALSRSEDVRNEINKDSTGLDIRQFLQKWSDGDDEYSTGGSGCKEIVQAISIEPKNINLPKSDQDQLVVLDLVNVSNEDLGKYEHIEKVSKLPDNIKGYTSIDLLNQFEEVTRTRPPEKKEMQARTAAFVHNMSTSLPSRPLSPLDVESKISQSVIHKDVGCNFEIRPCSPKMMNVELAAPARTLIEERIIEKVANPVNENTPIVPSTIDEQTNNYNVTKNKNQRKSVSRRQDNTANILSCKMIQTPYTSTSVDNEKSSYSLQDLESNSGVCFASLPRLDNDIELSFPEVNQQFINDYKVEPSTVNTDSKNLLTSNICSSENSSHDDTDKKILNNYPLSPTEKDVPRLSKYRKSKTSSEYVDTISQANAQLTRKDSVIIKNPENQHFSDEKTVSTLSDVLEKPKPISFSKEYLPMNLAMSHTTEFNVSTSQEETCAFNGEFVENIAINLSQHVDPSASTEGLSSALKKITSPDNPPLTITNDVTRVLLEELESSTAIDPYQCEIRPHTSTSLLNSDQKVINTKNYQLPEGRGQPECSSAKKTDSEETETKSRNIKQNDRRVPNTTTCSKEYTSSKSKNKNKNKIKQDVSTKCDGSLAKAFEETVPLESSRSPSYLTSKVSNVSHIHSNDTDVNARDDNSSRPHLKNLSDDKMLVPTSTDSVHNKDGQNIEENNCNAHHSIFMSIASTQYDIVNNTAILSTNESACVPKENYHDTNEGISSDHAESITTQSKSIDTQRIILNKSFILREKIVSSVKSTNTMDFETKVNELDNLSNIVKSDDSSYVLDDRIQDESETVIARAKTNKLSKDTKVISLKNTNCIQDKTEDHLDMKTNNSLNQAAEYITERSTPDELVNGREIRPEDSRCIFSDVHQEEKHIYFCDHPGSEVISLDNTNCIHIKAEDHLDVKRKSSLDQAAGYMTERATPDKLVNDPEMRPEDSRCVFSDVHQEEKHTDCCDHPESEVISLDNTTCVQNKAEDHLDEKTKSSLDQAAGYMTERATPDKLVNDPEMRPEDSRSIFSDVHQEEKNKDFSEHPESIVISLENTNCVQNKTEDHLDMKTKNSFDQAAEYTTERVTPDELVNGREIRPEDSRRIFSDVVQEEIHTDFCDHPESIITPAQSKIIELCIDTEIVKSNETVEPSENEHDNYTGCVRLDGSICAPNEVDDYQDVKKNGNSEPTPKFMNADATENELENDSGIITHDGSISVPGEDHKDVETTLLAAKQSSEIVTCEPTIDDLDNDIRSDDSSVLNEIHDGSKENICSQQSPKSLAVNPSVTELVNDMVNSKTYCVRKKDQQNTSNNVCHKTGTVVTTVERLSNNDGNDTNLVAWDDSEKYFNVQGTQSMTADPPANELKIAHTTDETDSRLNDNLCSVQVSRPMAGNRSVIAELDESHRVQQRNQQDTNAQPYSYENANKLNNESDTIESNYLVSNLRNQLEKKDHESLPTENRTDHGTKNNFGFIINENICGELFTKPMDTGRPKSEVMIALEDCNKNTAANSACKEHTKNIEAEQEVTKGIQEEQEAIQVIQKSMISIDNNSNNESIDVTNVPSHVTFRNSELLPLHKQSRDSTEVPNCIENENDTTAEPFNFLDRHSKSLTLSNIEELPFHFKPEKFGSVSHEQINLKFNEALVAHSIFPQCDVLEAESRDDTGMKSKAIDGEGNDVLNSSFYKRHKIADNFVKHRNSPRFYKRMYSPIFQKLYNYQEGSCCRTLESISKISKLGNYIEDIAIGVIDDISSDYVVNEIEKIPIGIPHEEVYQNIKNMQRHFALIDKTNEDSLENYKTMEFMQKHTMRESATLTKEESKVENSMTREPEIISSCGSSELNLNHDPDHIKMIHLPEISESTTVAKGESSSAKEESSCTDINLSINNISKSRELDDYSINSYLDISKDKEVDGGPLKQKLTDIETFSRRKLKRSLSESSLCAYRNNNKDRLNESSAEIESLHGSNKRKKLEKPLEEENSIPNIDVESVNYCSFLQNRRNSISTIYHDDDVSVCIFINDDCIITQEYDNETNSLVDVHNENLQSIIESSIEEDIEEVEAVNVPYHATEVLLPDPFSVGCIEERIAENWVEVACVETVVSDDIVEDKGDTSVDKSYSPNYEEKVQSEISEFDVYSDHTDKLKNIYGVGLCSNNFDLIKTLYTTPQMDVNKTLHCKESLLECDNRYECSDNDNTSNTLSNCIEDEMLCLHESREENFILDTDQCGQDAFEVLGLSLSSTITNNHTQTKDYIQSNASCIDDQLCDEPRTTYPPYKRTSSSPEVSSTTTEEKKSSILLKITNLNGSRTSHINNNNIAEDSKKIRCKFTENTDYSSCKSSTSRPLITKGAQKYIPPLKDAIHDLKVKLFLPQHRLKNLKYLKMTKDAKINYSTSRNLNSLKPALVKKKVKPNFEDVLKSIDEIHIKKHKDKSKGVPKVIIKKTDSGSHYTSIPDNDTFNPDMTGRKWQPWVFLEKNKFVDKMASQGKKNAVFCHRKNCYVLTENFKKYKSSSTKFVISQPSSKDMTTAPLRYTIKLKQSY